MTDQPIIEALVNLVVSIDLTDEETVDPDFAVSAFEDMTSTLASLSDEERGRMTQVIRSLAEAEASTQRRQALLELPGHLQLVDDEG
jgi:hypothetical protein